MTAVQRLASFVTRARFDDLSDDARTQIKIRVLDALGCAIGALGGEPVRMVRAHVDEFGGTGRCTLVGGGRTAPDRAALYNGALVRYLDFNDSYLAPRETCHPSDNLGAVLAAAEYAGADGRTLLVALAVAYQVQCRLSDVAPVRAKGFDHTTQGAYAVAAGVSRALGLDEGRTAHAIAISGTAFNALRVTRTGALSHWKGLAYPNTAFAATHATFLAMRGITGPPEVFEGPKGFMEAIAGRFEIDWAREDLERVRQTIVKRYNAEIHSQTSIEAALDLRRRAGFDPAQIERVEVDTFDVAFHIIGGGEEGDKTVVRTKEEADHSLPYMVAAALLDGQVMPEQYRPERIQRDDVQALLRRVQVRPVEAYSRQFPARMPSRVRVTLRDGRTLATEQEDYEGFHTRPAGWETIVEKFDRLSAPHADAGLRREIVAAVRGLETLQVADLTRLLASVRT
ncbi:MAG: MmgE/PrpD family protein [Armatimonadota bacterium]|nr:MmgE/PrpD family protein [Armatimonadota bacterium]MDR7453471.1 MmgE/PrpD family protein [Armatimonadota bacterium]MDR7457252.1 MmgE/PrpD family protein [Armatimonadota bacterium]MDR7496099.1 MmgE/PrpD family protein [Armatimonadota bacterium]MDR7511418.1 MmgE/PrpD family protein [Armatimonadota bacterium]